MFIILRGLLLSRQCSLLQGVPQSQTGRPFHVFSASYWSGKQKPTEYILGALVATRADGEVLYQQNSEP